MDDEGTSRIYYAMKGHLYGGYEITQEQLFDYDQNIVRHTHEINERRTEKIKELREQIVSGNLENDFQIFSHWIQALRFDRHLYYPILCLKEKDANGRKWLLDENTDEPLVKITPISLNVGETSFVKSVRDFYEKNKNGLLKGKEVYLLRNESRKGIGFFEASNFYPDFILWVNDAEKQHVTFIDPKGIRNLRGLKDAKIQLYQQLKTEVEPSLNDNDIILDSYIISNTPYNQVEFWGTKESFENNHVLFQIDSDYVKVLFERIMKQ